MNFENYLLEQINRHPSVQPQDIVKQCYQAAYGAEHLLSDRAAARNYLEREYALTEAEDIEVYEMISEDVCRINLAAWKEKGLPLEWLFNMFAACACVKENAQELFCNYLKAAEKIVMQGQAGVLFSDWQAYLADYKKAGMTAVHHSPQYRECERPAYRIVNSQYVRLLPILELAEREMRGGRVCVIAIDGRAASGKSTMSKQLKSILDADIIQMDDFFLPAELRTEERLHTPGGNVHYERFIEEVLPNLSQPEGFSYRIFDCSKMDYDGECVIGKKPFRIVEGSYSCHPAFGKYASITVFSDIKSEEQIKRIYHRNGVHMLEMFQERWIPLEEKYFEHYLIQQKVDVSL